MDSLTQIVLGAAVGEAVLGKKLGNWSLLLGAVAGTLPDMDVLATMGTEDPVRSLQIHRAYSHSMFTHILASFPLAWISNKLIGKTRDISLVKWYWFWFLGLFTHALLDCGTTYGTRLFLPFTDYQVAFNNISVIDPLYTLPFLALLVIMMFYKRASEKRKKWFKRAIMVSSAYMLLTFALKTIVHQKFRNTLVRDNIAYTELNSTPTILNAILWSGIAYDQDSLHVAEYSFLRPEIPIKWVSFPRNLAMVSEYDCEALQTFKWFSDGNYFVLPKGKDTIEFYTVKFGRMRLDTEVADETFMFYSTFYKTQEGIKYYSRDPKTARNNGDQMKEYFWLLMDRIGIINR
jgi:inner membrane protein